jgi:hypothetical protein
MVRRDGAEIRKERIQDIAKNIHRLLLNHGELQLSKVLAGLQYEYGLTREKLIEYLEILEGLGHFILYREHDKIGKERDEGHE